MNICIIGGGPTGLRIADELSIRGLNVELYEREKELGGCWKVEWEDGYFREHSPRVMTTNYTNTLKLAKKLDVNIKKVYGNKIYTSYLFIKYFYNNLDTGDAISVLNAITFMSKSDKRILQDWMIDNDISIQGQEALRKMALSVATNENEIMAYPFFSTIGQGQNINFVQFGENDMWLKKWEDDVVSRPNVKIFKKHEITSLQVEDNKIVSCRVNKKVVKADTFVCCVPLYSLKGILKQSNQKIQNNWDKFKNFEDYCIKSSYSGVGFQLHFKEKLQIPTTWETQEFTDWSIEMLDISKYSSKISENMNIVQVLSCVIVDTNARSEYLDKTPNQIRDINKVINESIRQLSMSFGITINPDKVTVSDGIKYNEKEKYWDMKYSAFHPTKKGELKTKGEIENLYSVGPHNMYEISILENCFKSADMFVNEYIKKIDIENDSSYDIRERLLPTGV